jgi:hypothetical protein
MSHMKIFLDSSANGNSPLGFLICPYRNCEGIMSGKRRVNWPKDHARGAGIAHVLQLLSLKMPALILNSLQVGLAQDLVEVLILVVDYQQNHPGKSLGPL